MWSMNVGHSCVRILLLASCVQCSDAREAEITFGWGQQVRERMLFCLSTIAGNCPLLLRVGQFPHLNSFNNDLKRRRKKERVSF